MDIYQHFRPEEHAFVDQVIGWKQDVETTYQYQLTDFLDPREQKIVETIVGTTNDDIQLKQFGGGAYTERKRIIIAPFYEEIDESAFELTLIEATYQAKFNVLTHRDVMGSFLSLGIMRKKLGDIFVENGIIQIILDKKIAPYVLTNLTSIKRAKIKFSEKPITEWKQKEPIWIESVKTVSSLRLDTVLKEIYQLSRKQSSEYISKKYVKVNYKFIEDAKFTLQEGDLISLRSKGRSKLVQVNGRTKKDKYKITTALLQ